VCWAPLLVKDKADDVRRGYPLRYEREVPEEFRSRIFPKFSQADASDTKQKSGSGLGLNISRALIKPMNGAIGTTLFFERPECQEAVQPVSAAPSGQMWP
jgi:hypothetical protein